MSDIDGLSAAAYRNGTDPIDWAIITAEAEIATSNTISAARVQEPSAFPGYFLELTPEATARRIVGSLLNAGWKPPKVDA